MTCDLTTQLVTTNAFRSLHTSCTNLRAWRQTQNIATTQSAGTAVRNYINYKTQPNYVKNVEVVANITTDCTWTVFFSWQQLQIIILRRICCPNRPLEGFSASLSPTPPPPLLPGSEQNFCFLFLFFFWKTYCSGTNQTRFKDKNRNRKKHYRLQLASYSFCIFMVFFPSAINILEVI